MRKKLCSGCDGVKSRRCSRKGSGGGGGDVRPLGSCIKSPTGNATRPALAHLASRDRLNAPTGSPAGTFPARVSTEPEEVRAGRCVRHKALETRLKSEGVSIFLYISQDHPCDGSFRPVPHKMKIEGHVYYIFGGASGLGEATTRRLHQQGAYVAIWDLNEERAKSVAGSLNAVAESANMTPGHGSPERALAHKIDICDTASILEAIAAADAKWKGVPLGGAVIASGIGMVGRTIDRDGTPHDYELFETIVRINLTGTFNAARLTASRLVRDVPKPVPAPNESTPCRGVIITVASQAGLEGQAGQLAYAVSKAGVAGMALPMARDLGWYGIRTVSICPTIFETPMSQGMPERAKKLTLKSTEFPARFGRPDEFAHAVQSVIENDMLNGFALRLDGGTRLGKL
ncbi:unnamed protein product [Parajaminaea phylloscopi]